MNSEDYPALYRSADQSSIGAQSAHLWLVRGEYSLLVLAAVVALWFGRSLDLYLIYIAILVFSTSLLLYMSVRKPEKDWYGCRALAESVKTATWRYMMRAEPFGDAPSLAQVKAKFASFLKEILDANSHVWEPISRRPVSSDQITGVMDAKRRMPLVDRKNCYLIERILEQRNWYVRRVQANRRQFRFWIGTCVGVQAAAIITALVRIRFDQQWSIWPTEPLLVLSASIVGWIQIKKFNELASAYSLTAHEIGIIQSRIDVVMTEKDFSDFVNEAERAFSREHTQWVARQTD